MCASPCLKDGELTGVAERVCKESAGHRGAWLWVEGAALGASLLCWLTWGLGPSPAENTSFWECNFSLDGRVKQNEVRGTTVWDLAP